MLFWVVLTVAIVFGLIAYIAFDKYDSELAFAVTMCISALSGIVAFFMLFMFIIPNHIGLDSYIAEKQAKYDSLVYQYENDFYDNDNDIGKRELMEDIRNWNQDIAWHKKAQNDLWLGIFHADIYDQFELISIEKRANEQ